MKEEEGGILSILEKAVEIETTQPPIDEVIPEEEIEEESEYKPRDYREKSFEDQLCDILDLNGKSYERQKRCANGIIDIFIYGQPPVIVEVKRAGTPFYLVQAIAQLKFYEACFKKPRLYISVPGGIDDEYRDIPWLWGINELRRVEKDGAWGFELYG